LAESWKIAPSMVVDEPAVVRSIRVAMNLSPSMIPHTA
jgi:hypothetical protein